MSAAVNYFEQYLEILTMAHAPINIALPVVNEIIDDVLLICPGIQKVMTRLAALTSETIIPSTWFG